MAHNWRQWGGTATLAVGTLAITYAVEAATGWPLTMASAVFLLYNRVKAEGSFENETRRRIFEEVRERPAQSISEIASTIGVSHSTASYHLDRLLEFNMLASTQDGNKMRFFINGRLFSEHERRALAALANAETRRMLATIMANPGCYRAELTQRLGVSSPTVNWHLARLLDAAIVTERPRGRNRYLFAEPSAVGPLLRDLSAKVHGTRYDASGLDELLTFC